MFRALLELLATILVIMVARAILTSVMRGVAKAGSNAFRGGQPQSQSRGAEGEREEPAASSGGELHRDPVCGTYVAESTPFHRRASGQTFYYCSEGCREKHALVAR